VKSFRYEVVAPDGQRSNGLIEADSLLAATTGVARLELAGEVVSIEDLSNGNSLYEPVGERPPPTPRSVDVKIGDVGGGWGLIGGGILFSAVALLFMSIGIGIMISGDLGGLWFALFPVIHLAAGVWMISSVLKQRAKRIRLYRDGQAIVARVQGAGPDRTSSVDRENPFELVWRFELDGNDYHDKMSSLRSALSTHQVGDPVWVVYNPEDPEESAIWPPLSSYAADTPPQD